MTDTLEAAKQAERALLGITMSATKPVIDDIEIRADEFVDLRHQVLWRLLKTIAGRGQLPDLVTTNLALQSLTPEDRRGLDAAFLALLVHEAPLVAEPDQYTKLVRQEAVRRRTIEAATRVAQMAQESADPSDLYELARTELDATIGNVGHSVRFLGETINDTIDGLDKPVTYTPGPWQRLNDMIGGFRPGGMYVVGARPGIGKTVVGLQVALELSKHGSVALNSLEMSRPEIEVRVISQLARVSMKDLGEHNVTNYGWEAIAKHRQSLDRIPMSIDDRGNVTPEQIRAHARAVNRRKPLAGIVVDYLGLMAAPKGDRRNRNEIVAEFSRQLKLMAKDLNVPVIVLSQLNRNSTQRESGKPMISDLRESGAVEQDADVIMLLHRAENPHQMEVGVAKNRHGQTGSFTLDFEGVYARCADPTNQ